MDHLWGKLQASLENIKLASKFRSVANTLAYFIKEKLFMSSATNNIEGKLQLSLLNKLFRRLFNYDQNNLECLSLVSLFTLFDNKARTYLSGPL